MQPVDNENAGAQPEAPRDQFDSVGVEAYALADTESVIAGAESVAPELDWKRVHKATPFIRGWLVIVAVLVGGAQSFGQGLIGGNDDQSEYAETISRWEIYALLGTAVIALLIAVGYGYLAWRKMRYAYDDESVYMNSGIVFRQERKVRLDRIQSIDIVRPLVARIFGLAELTITSAAGGESNVQIGFLKEPEANQLRVELLARASGAIRVPDRDRTVVQTVAAETGAGEQSNAPGEEHQDTSGLNAESPERTIYQVPPGRIIGSGLLSWATIFALLFVIAIVVLLVIGQTGIAVSLLPGLLGFGPVAWNSLVGEYGFVGAISADGIRVRHGLLETRAKTIPPGRVQAVRIRQSLLWRGLNWWRVDVNVAGQSIETNGSNISMESVLLPVGTPVEAVDALWLVLPDLGIADPLAVLNAAMTGKDNEQGFTVSPRSARWLDPFSFRRNGFVETERALIFRTGWLVRTVVVVPHERTQSIGAKQGPWQRKLKLASFSVHSTPGAIVPHVPHQSLEVVRELLAEQAERARKARASAGPEKWLEQVAQPILGNETREQ